MTETPTIYIAKESAVLRVGGDKYVIRKDRTRVEAGHPMIAQHPDLFREVDPEADVHYRAPGVETARQEPVIPTPSAEQAAAEQAAAEAAAAEGEKPKRRGGSASS